MLREARTLAQVYFSGDGDIGSTIRGLEKLNVRFGHPKFLHDAYLANSRWEDANEGEHPDERRSLGSCLHRPLKK